MNYMTPWNSVTNWSVTTYHDARSHCHGLLYANDYLTEIIIMTHFLTNFGFLLHFTNGVLQKAVMG